MFEPNWHSKSVLDPAAPTARPVVRGTRVAVDFVMELLSDGWTPQEIARHFGHITADGKADGIEVDDETAGDGQGPDLRSLGYGDRH